MSLAKEPKLDIDFAHVVENRGGAVLTKGTILKAEHFGDTRHIGMREPSDEQLLMGAPNWRGALLKICGTAQPTTVGLATILRILGCGPEGEASLCLGECEGRTHCLLKSKTICVEGAK